MTEVALEKLCVREETLIKDAVRHLHDAHQRIILVTDGQRRLKGVISDSDIRHAILRAISFDRPVSEIMVKNPIVVTPDMADEAVVALMKSSHRYEIPVVDAEMRVIGLKTIYALLEKKPVREAVVMAGGLGTRLLPLTETTPKPLLTVGQKPILFIVLDQLIKHGVTKITIAVNYKADMIKKAVQEVSLYKSLVHFVEENEPLGTAGALSLLTQLPTEPFFVVNADLLTKADFGAMMQLHETEKNEVTVAVKEENFQVPFGVVKLDGSRVTDLEEKPSQSLFVNAGIYVLNPSAIKSIPRQSHFTMVDLIHKTVGSGKRVGSFPVYEYWMDIGAHENLRQANQTFDV